MTSLAVRLKSGILLLALAAGLPACASVKVSIPGLGNEAEAEVTTQHSERVALRAAAEDLARHPWGTASTDPGMMSVLFGRITTDAREKAVADYLALVDARHDDAVAAVLSDADTSLAKARRVAEAGRQAVAAITPVPSDIDILEGAIGEVRECRAMFVAALETLDREGRAVPRTQVAEVRDAFSQTLTDIGQTADLVADRVAAAEGQSRLANDEGKPSRLD